MEDMNNPSHAMGVGQQHPHLPTHTRPFFYVHPPSHPSSHPPYVYPWNMLPYGQYVHPPTAWPGMRPYMAPYPYMQYPGYIIPQAPLQHTYYRRMYEPQASASYDVSPCRPYQPRHVRRLTTSSEAQTEPTSDPVHQLIGSLVGLRAGGKEPGATEQEAAVSEMLTPPSGFKDDNRKLERTPMVQRMLSSGSSQRSESQTSLFDQSTMTKYNGTSRQSPLSELTQNDMWSLGSGVTVLPQDSSSNYDKEQTEEEEEEAEETAFLSSGLPHCSSQTGPLARIDTHSSRQPGLENESRSDGPDLSPEEPGVCGFPIHSLDPHESPGDFLPEGLGPPDPGNEVHILYQPVSAELNNTAGKVVVGRSPRILRFPCNKVTTGMLEGDDPLWYVDSPLAASSLEPPGAFLSSARDGGSPGAGGGFYHSYYPPMCPDRQSILSPSLDELSSRDELFSTDVEDQDLIPMRVLIGGKMAADTLPTCGGAWPDHASEKNEPVKCPEAAGLEQCLKRCAACGTSLEEMVGRQGEGAGYCGYAEGEESDEEEGGDEDEWEGLLECCPIAASGRPHLPSVQSRRGSYPCCPPPRRTGTRSCYEGYGEVGDRDQRLGHSHYWDQDCYRPVNTSKPDGYKERGPRNGPLKPCNDRPTRDGAVTSDQESWGSDKHKPQFWRQYNGSQEAARASRRRPACRAFVQQRPQRTAYDDSEEAEFLSGTRGRGSTKRRGTRY